MGALPPSQHGFEIRGAQPGELRALRRLMPALYKAEQAPDRVLVALHGDEITGAAAIAWRLWGTPPGFPVFVHVLPPWRRKGIGRSLLGAAATACAGEAERFHGWTGLDESAPEAAFARAVGCTVNRRVLHFEADGARFFSLVDPIYERMRAHAKVPADAEVVPLGQAAAAPVARLVSETFGSRYDAVLASVRGQGAAAYDREKSVVLLQASEVRGALLYRWRNGLPEIDVNVVAPALRRGWANLVLLREATRNGLAGGGRLFRFSCDDRVTDTVKLARRAQARLLRASLEFAVPLETLSRVLPTPQY